MSEKSIRVYHMYPDLLNLYGDKGNVCVLKKRCEMREIEFSLKTLNEGEIPDFSDVDIVLLGGGSSHEQFLVSEYRDIVAKPLSEYVEDGGVLLAMCEGYQLLGNFYEHDGKRIECFKVLDIDTLSGEDRLIGNAAIEANLGSNSVTIVGFENHSGRTDIKNHTPFGRVIFGFGNDGKGTYEGVIYKNTVATYLHGPILPKNPELADFLIEAALKRKGVGELENGLCKLDDTIEKRAKSFIIERESASNKA